VDVAMQNRTSLHTSRKIVGISKNLENGTIIA